MNLNSNNNRDKLLKRHVFCFNPNDNGGESLLLTTEFFWNGDEQDGIYTNQELILQSYLNSASITLFGAAFTPENLRKLADELVNVRAQCIVTNKKT